MGTKMGGDDFVHQTTSQQHGSNHLFAPCQCGSMRGGIRFNSILVTLRDAHTAPTTLKPYESRFMPTAVSAEFISQIACIQRMNCLLSSNCSYPFRKHNNDSFTSVGILITMVGTMAHITTSLGIKLRTRRHRWRDQRKAKST